MYGNKNRHGESYEKWFQDSIGFTQKDRGHDNMNIMIASNSKYIPFCKVMLSSLFSCESADEELDIYMPYEGLSSEEVEDLRRFICEDHGKRFFPMPISAGFKEKVTSHNGISIETYYRILAIDLLPDTVDKILYLDCDMVVRKSLRPLYDTEFTGNTVFAVCEDIIGILNGFHEANKRRMNIPAEYSYFNAGVMLMNIETLKAEGACEKIVDRIYTDYARYEYNDQDVLNEMYYDRLIFLPWQKYNCPPAVYYIEKTETSEGAGTDETESMGSCRCLTYSKIKEFSKDPERFVSSVKDVTSEIYDNAHVIHYMANTKPWSGNRPVSKGYDLFDKAYFEARERAALVPNLRDVLSEYLAQNYDLIYLEGMLSAAAIPEADTLILGSSYGITDIDMRELGTAVNLSATSQDLGRDLLMLNAALSKRTKPFENLLLLLGEYALYDDMEKSAMGRHLLDTLYPRLLEGADRWRDITAAGLCNVDKQKTETATRNLIYEKGNFFNDLYTREDNCEEKYKDLRWVSASSEERASFAGIRTADHNRLYKPDSDIPVQNTERLKEILSVASAAGMNIYVILPPFTPEYEAGINPAMKREMQAVLDEAPFIVNLLDLRELVEDGTFTETDFFDMDHLSESGAVKLSRILKGILYPG